MTEIATLSFVDCYSLTSLIIPDSVTSIGGFAFYECSALKEIVLSKNLTSLGSGAWEKCEAIEKVVYRGSEPVTAYSGCFEAPVYDNATLFIPKGKTKEFKEVIPWNLFKNIEEDETNGVEEVAVDFATDYEVYNLSGVKVGNNVDALPAGIYIVRQDNAVTKVAVK